MATLKSRAPIDVLSPQITRISCRQPDQYHGIFIGIFIEIEIEIEIGIDTFDKTGLT